MQIETELKKAVLTNQNEDNLQGNIPEAVVEIRPFVGILGTVALSIKNGDTETANYPASIVVNISELKEVVKRL